MPEPRPSQEHVEPEVSEPMPNARGLSPTPITSARSNAVVIPLGFGRHVEVSPTGGNARLRVQGDNKQAIDIEIRFDACGPIVSVRAPTLEIEATERVSTVCDTFSVHARQSITLHADGDIVQRASERALVQARRVDVEASPGAISLKANDEVQLLGEMILLNCEPLSTEGPSRRGLDGGAPPSGSNAPGVRANLTAQDRPDDTNVVSDLLSRDRTPRND